MLTGNIGNNSPIMTRLCARKLDLPACKLPAFSNQNNYCKLVLHRRRFLTLPLRQIVSSWDAHLFFSPNPVHQGVLYIECPEQQIFEQSHT